MVTIPAWIQIDNNGDSQGNFSVYSLKKRPDGEPYVYEGVFNKKFKCSYFLEKVGGFRCDH